VDGRVVVILRALMFLVVALFLAFVFEDASAYPQYRDEVPNGLRSVDYDSVQVTALGHTNGHGGGDLNVFGKAFRSANYEWTNQLCMSDSDGDGESNGLELGDPCCLWKVGHTPMRQWGLSHPGDPKYKTNLNFSFAYTCVSKKGDENFWKFYFDDARDFHYKTFSEDLSVWWNTTVASIRTQGLKRLNPFASGDGDVFMRSSKDLFTTLVLVCTLLTLCILIFAHRCGLAACHKPKSNKVLTLRYHLWILFAAFMFTDWMSGLLHVVLDNPVMNNWPVIGPEAKAFQGHHYDPTAVARGNWMDFLREHHILVFLVMAIYLIVKPSSPGLMLFSLHFMWMSHVMMAAHRWSHTHPKYLSSIVKFMMSYHIVMNVQHHSAHHASYDCNFCIFSGWMNPLLNQLVHIIHWRSPMWVFVLAGFAFVPLFVTNSTVQEWLLSKMEAPYEYVKLVMTRLVTKAGTKTTVAAVEEKTNAAAGLEGDKRSKTLSIFLLGSNLNTAMWRRRASFVAVMLGLSSTGLILYGLFASGSWKGTGFTRFLVSIHVLCMSIGCLVLTVIAITSYSWNTFDENDPRWSSRKSSLRSIHRSANMLSALFFLLGMAAMLLHLWIKEHTLLHDKTMHTRLGLATLSGIVAQVVSGLVKFPYGGYVKKKYKWHGSLGWIVFICMFLTVNSGVAESGFFTNLVQTQIIIQIMLFSTFMTVAFTIKKMPPFTVHLENPVSFLIKEHLAIYPRILSIALVRLPFCSTCQGFADGADGRVKVNQS